LELIEELTQGAAAYLDDIHILDHSIARAMTTRVKVDDKLHAAGMSRNRTKNEIYAPQGNVPVTIEGTQSKGWVKVFGSPAGHDTAAMSDFCVRKVRKMETFFKLATHPQMPKKVQFGILRMCTTCRITFLQRSTPPDITEEAVQIFDAMHFDAIKALLGSDVTENETAMSLTYLPLRVGGLGLRSAQLVQAFAYECSIGAEQSQEGMFDALRLDPDQQARCLSSSGTAATRFATHFTPSTEHKVSDAAFLAALRTRIGLAPLPAPLLYKSDIPITCQCDIPNIHIYDHALLCPRSKGDAKRTRHDAVKNVVVEYLRAATAFVYPEPPGYTDNSAKRPDIICRTPTLQVAIEVSVTHPLAAATRANAAIAQGYAGRVRSQEKMRKYAGICVTRGDVIIPLVAETYGTVNEEFLEFLEILPRNSAHPERLHQSWRDNLLAAISCAVQEGNYEMWRRYVHGPMVVPPF
jgi:hypothetical protein